MSLGDALRQLLDPVDPAVVAWLQRELPRLVAAGILERPQAAAIARRYGVRLDDPDADLSASAPGPAVPPAARPTPPPGDDAPETEPIAPPAAAGPVPPARAASPFFAEHAVSIVLYLGAFLVVSAVVIFLAYSWGEITGGARLAALLALTAGFLGAAALCLPRPAVRPAGRTFLALGAILVPANVAAVYLVYFQDGPLPGALFWLLGALTSGGLHAALSWRLGSRAYGALAVLAVPVAAGALAWLVEPRDAVLGPASAAGLALTLAAARPWPARPLVQAARGVGGLLLPLAVLISLPALGESGWRPHAAPVALLFASTSLAWEATRGGRTWWIGAASTLVLAPFLAIALAAVEDRPPFVATVALSSWLAALTARRLQRQQALLWDLAALLPALLYPLPAWEDDRAALALLASLTALAGLVAWGRRSTLPLYAGVLALDAAYVKLLELFGAPDAPPWALGVALWPVAAAWGIVGTVVPRRLSGPAWAGALVTFLGAAALTLGETRWSAGVAASAALATAVAAWRLGLGPLLLLAVPWLLLAGYRGGELAALGPPWRHVAAGLSGWLPFAAALLPAPRSVLDPAAGTGTRGTEGERADGPPDPDRPRGQAERGSPPAAVVSPGSSAPGADRPLAGALGGSWRRWAWLAAVATAGIATLFVTALLVDGEDRPWLAAGLAWANLALLLAAWAWLVRSHTLALLAALAGLPVLLFEIARFAPADGQAYALPGGLYLLAIAWLDRRARPAGRRWPASAVAAAGLLILLGTGVVQSLDADRFGHAVWTLAESLVLVGLGIAVRWRVLLVGGVAGTVLVAVRQLFDAVAALPGWAILGGSGLILLAAAVALLLARARLAAAGRAAAERWSTWD